MTRRSRMAIIVLALLGVCFGAAACAILNQEKFGRYPQGDRLARVEASPNYRDGEFRNTVSTPMLAEGQSSVRILAGSLFSSPQRLRPSVPLPTVKPDLSSLDPDSDLFIWLGHSSYFIQLGGKRILVDPVFSDFGAPFSFANRIFPGTDLFSPADMPDIDILLISHDHWDHLDYPTVRDLLPKVQVAVMPLGVGEDFERWGYPAEKILEADWNDTLRFDALAVHFIPARHFSGRTLTRNKTLWTGFVLEGGDRRILLSGDSGYGPHFEAIARTFDGFDLVALDGGQYDPRWPFVHMTPEQAVTAATILNADAMLLAHVGRFAIAAHPWDEPFIRAVAEAERTNMPLLTPRIGEPMPIGDKERTFSRWWEDIR